MKRKLIYFLIFLASFIASRDLFKKGYFSMHDDLQIGRLYQMELCFRDGQIPCRWVPDMGFSYGYPLFNYYPPFPYYTGMIFRALGFSFIDSTKILFVLGFFASGVFMYWLGRELWGETGGLVSSIFYLFAPYHSVDVYVRGAMNEFWALAWFPLIFFAALKVVKEKDTKNILLLGLSYGLLLLTHNAMSMLFTPWLVLWAILLIWLEKKEIKEKLINLSLAGFLGVGLASFFFLPVVFEGKFVHTETMLMGYFNYLAHFVGIKKMLFTRFWGYGSSGWLQEAGMPFQVGIPQWPIAVLVFFAGLALCLKKRFKPNVFFLFSFFFFLFSFSLFMVHPRSVFIWLRLSPLSYVQFPWRFLALVIFGMSVLGGGIVSLLKTEKLKLLIGGLLVLSAIGLNFSFFKMENLIQITDEEKLFSAKGWRKLQTDAIFDYLPKAAKFPPDGPAPEKPIVLQGKADITKVEKGTDWYRFRANVDEETVLQIPVYYFPGWQIFADGKKKEIFYDNDLGLITIRLSAGDYQISARFSNTPIRSFGNLLSLISWGGIIYLTGKKRLSDFLHRRKQ